MPSIAPGADSATPRLARRALLRRAGLTAAFLAAGGGSIVYYGARVEPFEIQTSLVPIEIARLPRQFDGYTIAQISDLHFGPYIQATHIRTVVDMVQKLEPRLIVMTGDHITRVSPNDAESLSSELSRLNAHDGVLSILGNHDYWTNPDVVVRLVRRAGMTLLRNENTAVEIGSARLFVAGVDDVWERKHDLEKALAGIPAESPTILLAHEPDFADEAARDPRLALQLSGHSHGGQVKLPLIGAPMLPAMAHKYPEGLYQVGKLRVYTNRGIGVVGPGVRLNCPPEITVFELRAG